MLSGLLIDFGVIIKVTISADYTYSDIVTKFLVRKICLQEYDLPPEKVLATRTRAETGEGFCFGTKHKIP